MTHVIAFQILNKTHMLAHGHEQTPKTTMPNSWIYDYITITKCDTIDYTTL